MSTIVRACPCNLVRSLVAAALLAGLAAPPAPAAVPWKSGPRTEPRQMGAAELARTLDQLARRPSARHVVIHFDAPLSAERRALVESRGVRLLGYLGANAYFANLTESMTGTGAATVPGIVAVEAIDPAHKLHPDLAAGTVHPWAVVPPTSRQAEPSAVPEVAVYVMFHADVDLDREAPLRVAASGGLVASTIRSIHAVVAHLPADRVTDLAAADAVMWVEPPLPKLTELNADNGVRTGAKDAFKVPYTMDGSGVTVLIYDGGRALAHGDLAGRHQFGQSDTSAINDHSTHVACTVAGSGAGGAQFRGMAPGADIVSYGFQNGGGAGFLYTNPGDLEHDYTEAIELHGADLSNNSIGSNVATNGFPCDWEGNYGVTSALIDEVVRGSLGAPFRVVWANGNERQTVTCGDAYHTTGPPSCNKNAVAVGALNSNDDSVTSFTSWGPCDDGRLKPDVSAPGCQNGGDGGVSSCSSSGGYNVKCGTSMASPTVAGIAALLLEKYRELYPARPDFRNSLLRATLAHTAVDLGNAGPDYQSGYGSIRALPAADVLIDERFEEGTLAQGEAFSFTVLVQASDPRVRVTLAWDDPAGVPLVDPALVNDLDLQITDPGGTVHHPWTLDPGNPAAPAVRTVRDSVNNIEQVVIDDPQPGEYLVEIEAFDIAQGPAQPFSVVASPNLNLCLLRPSFDGIETATAGSSCAEIDLSWSPAQSNCPSGQVRYNVYRSTQPGFTPSPQNRVAGGIEGTTLTDTFLQPGVTYYYVVRSVDSSSGEEANLVERSAASPTGPDLVAPVFLGLSAATPSADCGQTALSWAAAAETCSLPVRYEIHRSTDLGFVPGPDTLVATTFSTGFVDTGAVPGTDLAYVVRAVDAADNGESNEYRIPVTPIDANVLMFTTGFEADAAGWTLAEPNDAGAGSWEWGDPQATSYQPESDATENGVNCWITELSATPSNGDVDNGTTTLVSATYDMSGATAPKVAYSRWFTNDRGSNPGEATDLLRVDVSNDGGAGWSPLEQVGAGTPLAWVPIDLPLPVAPTSQMRFRFIASDLGSGSAVEAGIDEFALIDDVSACQTCGELPPSTLCQIAVDRQGTDVLVSWSVNPVDTRAVIYHIGSCDPADRIKLGTSAGDFFVHESAISSSDRFNYRVTFVDDCGNEVGFCGASDCP